MPPLWPPETGATTASRRMSTGLRTGNMSSFTMTQPPGSQTAHGMYRDIQAILLPDRDGSCTRQDLRIPLLAEYVRVCKRYEKVCVLELKNPFLREDIENIIEIVRGEEYLSNVIFIAFSLENCTQLRELLPGQRIQWLLSQPVDEKVKQTLLQHHLDIDLDYLYMSKALVEELHAGHIKVNCWTCNDSGTAGELIAMGVDFITTNILE